MSDVLPIKSSKTMKVVIGIIIVVILICIAVYYFVIRPKSKAAAVNEGVLSMSQFSAADKSMYQTMLKRFKEITGKTDSDIFWVLEDMDKRIQANDMNLPAGYFFEGGRPMLSGYLLAALEAEWYGYGYNDKAKDDQWNVEFSNMLQSYEAKNFATRYN